MATITNDVDYFLKITFRGRNGSGGKDGGLQIAPGTGSPKRTVINLTGGVDNLSGRYYWDTWSLDYIMNGTPSVPKTRQEQYDY